jgi:hypothetical protein
MIPSSSLARLAACKKGVFLSSSGVGSDDVGLDEKRVVGRECLWN